jgi:hypothetical protein
MKTMICIVLCFALASCKEGFESVFPLKTNTAISVLTDGTDTSLSKPKADEVLKLYGLSDDYVHDGFKFRQSAISDVANNRVDEANVVPVQWYASDDNHRIAELKAFKKRISFLIDSLDQGNRKPKKHSLVYQAINAELINLVKTKAENKYLVIYSDMLQNSDEFSFYNPASFELAKSNPDKVIARFEQMGSLPDLTGIKIYVINNPHSYVEQKKFDVAVNVFKILVQEKHGELFVQSNILPETNNR